MYTPPIFFKDNESEWEYAAEGITRKFIGYNPQLMLVKVKFEKYEEKVHFARKNGLNSLLKA
mgnify:CR=1 FL=1